METLQGILERIVFENPETRLHNRQIYFTRLSE